MAIELPRDFSEFLKSLSSRGVRFLVVGGYAVAWHGYPRATQDLDVWIGIDPGNAAATVDAIREFGFDTPNLSEALFLERDKVVRMGFPPIRIEVLTSISGLEFEEAWTRRIQADFGSVTAPLINLEDLKTNKRAAARHKDLDDLEHLP
jgi:predicted nucleotidyltransferase